MCTLVTLEKIDISPSYVSLKCFLEQIMSEACLFTLYKTLLLVLIVPHHLSLWLKVLWLTTNFQVFCSYSLPFIEQLTQQHECALKKNLFSSLHTDNPLAEISFQMKKCTNKDPFKCVPSLLITKLNYTNQKYLGTLLIRSPESLNFY